ncbi:MAG TPA: poly-gamma-glutamate hydrolase family protein [Chitinophagales bacterium]|nr:poly-gamma-glutamate hydrolase family protein [Chitinophagales bacterium]
MKKDKYSNFKALKKSVRSEFYNIEIKIRDKGILIFSPHGGGIEQGTSEICKCVANYGYSYYLFEGKRKNCKRLHITSTNFDEPTLLRLLSTHQDAISIHGMTDELAKDIGADIFIGGLNRNLITITTKVLLSYNFRTSNNIENNSLRLNGTDLNNVTNRCSSRKGMQIEISEKLRTKFFVKNFKLKRNRNATTKHFDKFCEAIGQSVTNFLHDKTLRPRSQKIVPPDASLKQSNKHRELMPYRAN